MSRLTLLDQLSKSVNRAAKSLSQTRNKSPIGGLQLTSALQASLEKRLVWLYLRSGKAVLRNVCTARPGLTSTALKAETEIRS